MTPVGVFFICQNEDKCHFVNSTLLEHILEQAYHINAHHDLNHKDGQ